MVTVIDTSSLYDNDNHKVVVIPEYTLFHPFVMMMGRPSPCYVCLSTISILTETIVGCACQCQPLNGIRKQQ